MSQGMETGIIIALIILAAAFVVLRIISALRGRRPSCCSGRR
jgi:hypothetical protein